MDEDLSSSSFAFIIALTPRALPPPPPAATSNRAPPRGHGHVPGERAAHLEHQRVHGGRGLHPHDAGASTPAPPLCEIARHLRCLPPSAAIVPLTSLSRDPQGPRGLDKLVHDDKGVTTISNDGATIMKVRREAPISRAARRRANRRFSYFPRFAAAGGRVAPRRARFFLRSTDAPVPILLPLPRRSFSTSSTPRRRASWTSRNRKTRRCARRLPRSIGRSPAIARERSSSAPLRPSFKKKTEPPTE